MSNMKLANLALKLHEKTEEGSVDWEETANKGIYQAVFGAYILKIFAEMSEFSGPEEPDIVIQILNDDGDIVEGFSDNEVAKYNNDDITMYRIMKETYDMARRSALGSDKAVDAILKALDESVPF